MLHSLMMDSLGIVPMGLEKACVLSVGFGVEDWEWL